MAAALVACVSVFVGGECRAAGVAVDLGAGTYIPLSLGAEANVELPARILVRGGIGVMPSAYSDTIVNLLGDFSVLNAFDQALLNTAIQNAVVARVSAGWRPFPRLGFEALVGYTLITIGGGVSSTDVVDAYLQSKGLTDRSPPGAQESVPIAATLHNLDATVGWRFLLFDDKLVLRASLGYLQCVASSMTASETTSRPASQALTSRINQELASNLNPYFTEYVKVPVVGLTAAYRF